MEWQGKHALIIGAARQGIALATYLSQQGAKVTLSDLSPAENFVEEQKYLAQWEVQWDFGQPDNALLDSVDLLCLSGGVSPEIPIAREAQSRLIPISNDSQLFFEVVPCPVIGITGSAGKTTTTMLVGRIMRAMLDSGAHKAWVGGNIGSPLISVVDQMQAEDIAIAELSSFQLELMNQSPHVAALLNLAPNHLDRHSNMADYAAAKAHILDFQGPNDIAVLGREDTGAWAMQDRVQGQLWSFGLADLPDGEIGSFVADEHICLQDVDGERRILPMNQIELRGGHNLLNVLAAAAIAKAAGASDEAISAGVEGFRGADHRLELVRELNGVDWYNDSIATSPQRAQASLNAFERPIVLLAGGRDKGLDWQKFAKTAASKAKTVLAFGEAADLIESVFETLENRKIEVSKFHDLRSAMSAAANIASEGDVVLLAPGGTSFDEFNDFEERGRFFREWVSSL